MGNRCLPEYRPGWWLRELPQNQQHLKDFTFFPQGCETSSGFPTTTILLSMALAYVVLDLPNHRVFSKLEKCMKYSMFITVLGLVWLGSLYLMTEFLHQCVLTTLITWIMLEKLEKIYPLLRNMKRRWFIAAIVGIACLPFSVYVGKLKMGIDPHWSVRMVIGDLTRLIFYCLISILISLIHLQAFKWCDNRNYLRYESSPIFSLARDFGYLMGYALSSTTIAKR